MENFKITYATVARDYSTCQLTALRIVCSHVSHVIVVHVYPQLTQSPVTYEHHA